MCSSFSHCLPKISLLQKKQISYILLCLQVTAASDVVFINGGLKSAVKMLMNVNSFFHANYQDILPLVIDGRKFLIDGDSLLMHALNSKGLCLETGGTTLHVVYLVEKFLATFRAKGLNFVLIFFEVCT